MRSRRADSGLTVSDDIALAIRRLQAAQPDWVRRARCTGTSMDEVGDDTVNRTRSMWWRVGRNDSVDVEIDGSSVRVTAASMVRCALLVCQMCPVQWECAEFAIEGDEAFTWAASETDRRWFAENVADWREQLAQARSEGLPVQQLISRTRQESE